MAYMDSLHGSGRWVSPLALGKSDLTTCFFRLRQVSLSISLTSESANRGKERVDAADGEGGEGGEHRLLARPAHSSKETRKRLDDFHHREGREKRMCDVLYLGT